MVKLEDITSACEVALAANFVIGHLVLKQKAFYEESIKAILNSEGEEFSEEDNCFLLKNGKKFSKKNYHKIGRIFYTSIVLSSIAVIASFFTLLFAGIYPDLEISTSLYIFAAIFFVIINPIVYFRYEIATANFLLSIKESKNKISDFMKNYVPFPVCHESTWQKLRWFLHFKKVYIKSLFKNIFKSKK